MTPDLTLDPSAFVAGPELLAALLAHAESQPCPTERTLFSQGEAPVGLFILKSGPVRLSINALDGEPIAALDALPGSLLGLPALISDQPYGITAIALPGAELAYLSRDHFTLLMRAEPPLAMQTLKVFDAQLRAARQLLFSHISRPLPAKPPADKPD